MTLSPDIVKDVWKRNASELIPIIRAEETAYAIYTPPLASVDPTTGEPFDPFAGERGETPDPTPEAIAYIGEPFNEGTEEDPMMIIRVYAEDVLVASI